MLRSCVMSLCRNGKGKVPFKVPLPGSTTTFKSINSDATDFDAMNVDSDMGANILGDDSVRSGAYSQQEVIQQYSEKSINNITLLGRVGINPQLRGTEAHPVVSFSLATNIQYRPGGSDSSNSLVKKTEWHNVVVFRPHLRDSVYNYVTKGGRVMVQGRIMYGSIEDKQGNLRSTTSIVAEDVIRFA